MNREHLRQLFGKTGDVNLNLAAMYGKAYLDYPDDSGEDIPDGLGEMGCVKINGILDRQYEAAPEIGCESSQGILLDYLKKYISGEFIPATAEFTEQLTAVFKHERNCGNPKCHKLSTISHMDKYLTPEDMKNGYGEIIENWKIE